MAKMCLCLTGKTISRDLELLERYRKYLDLVELRVDCLEPDERLQIRRFPELAGIPVILTIRRDCDGGFFVGGEGSRITLFSKALAFADVDRRRNFAYVDMEEDLNLPSLEEAARTFGTRIIRSYHNFAEVDENLEKRLQTMSHVGDEILKAALMPQTVEDVVRVYRAARNLGNADKILLCMGNMGQSTRILAGRMGSYLSYTSAKDPDLPAAAPGQFDPQELIEGYRFRNIGPRTQIFGVLGFPLTVSDSPGIFNPVFTEDSLDAVYIPFPADSLDSFMILARELGLRGLSVTVPYKEKIISYLAEASSEVDTIEACNTIVMRPQGWVGYNTDARGFSDSLLAFIGKKDLRGKTLTIIGAGGVARAVAAEIFRLKGKALILNRTPIRAKELALRYRFAWGGLDLNGVEQMDSYQDIIIQTSSVGMLPESDADPLELYKFRGHEVVMDLIYKPAMTPFLRRAAAAGCMIQNGADMLLRQAQYQYQHFMGREFPLQSVPGKIK